MKILHFYKTMNAGGAETFIMNVYRKIDRNKYQFDFLCSSNEKGFYDKEIKQLGGNIYYYKISKNPIITAYRIVKTIKKNGPYDAVHSPMMHYSSIICISAKICRIKKIIVHSHSAGTIKKNKLIRKIYVTASRYIINCLATSKIACGIDAAQYLFGTTKDVTICHNGIDLDRFHADYTKEIQEFKKENKLKNEVIIGEVASFLPVKNHDYYIDLAHHLIKKGITFKIILIGEGTLKESFIKKINSNKLEDKFIVLSATNEIPFFMNLFDIYMMPSLYEGFPLSVIEASACGDKCILSDKISKETSILGKNISFFSLDNFPNTQCIVKKKGIDRRKIRSLLSRNNFLIDNSIDILEQEYDKSI